jgi:S-DNA-T family DNA segregation ATPase FtsK/SpoIIIE
MTMSSKQGTTHNRTKKGAKTSALSETDARPKTSKSKHKPTASKSKNTINKSFARRPATKAPASPAPDNARKLNHLPKSSETHSQKRRSNKSIGKGLTLDRKLDILGISLALVGLLTLLSMISPIRGSLTGDWTGLLGLVFGWGMYFFPFILIGTGLWLVLRNFERIPLLSIERLAGLALLFLNLLTILHLVLVLTIKQDPLALAQKSLGGGYMGGWISKLLISALGTGGAAIALAAWLWISLALSLDITIAQMLGGLATWIEQSLEWAQRAIQDLWEVTRRPSSSEAELGEFRPAMMDQITPPVASVEMLKNVPPFVPQLVGIGQTQTIPWKLPPIEQILDAGNEVVHNDDLDIQRARVIEETLLSFGAPAKVIEINRGPTITQFGVEPDFIESRSGRMRVRVGKIAALADDLALALSARTIRVQAPVPGRGFVGIEVPNEDVSLVALRDLIESEAFKRLKSPLRFALGLNVSGNAVAADLSNMPHLLIAGATGSGKSVCVNALICCLLMNNTPDDLRLVMVDPKRVELTGYNGIPHLLAPVVVELERVITVLQWVTREMDMRYRKLAEAGCRNIQEYNGKAAGHGVKRLPFLVVFIDELADLMMLAPDETEKTVTRLAQLARATGIHLVISTQRPSVDVVTGLIKANFPARIAFAVASGVDSRVILDQPGAERLLGRGDMLFQAPDSPAPVRLQGVFVSESEIQRLVSYWQEFVGLAQLAPTAAGGIVDALPSELPLKQIPLWDDTEEEGDPLLKEAIDLARRQGRASISMLQRRLRIGYTRAARLIETMEEKGIVGPPDPGTGTREILDYGQAAPPADEN